MQLLLNRQSGKQRTASMILVSNGGAKQRHESITQELINRPFVTMHFRKGQFKISREIICQVPKL